MTKMIAAGGASVTFAGFHAHGPIRAVCKALEFDRRNGGPGHEKGQTEKRKNQRQLPHGSFLLFIDPRLETALRDLGPLASSAPFNLVALLANLGFGALVRDRFRDFWRSPIAYQANAGSRFDRERETSSDRTGMRTAR